MATYWSRYNGNVGESGGNRIKTEGGLLGLGFEIHQQHKNNKRYHSELHRYNPSIVKQSVSSFTVSRTSGWTDPNAASCTARARRYRGSA